MESTETPRIEFVEERLPNGLWVVLAPNDRIPLAHVALHYRIGSSYETPGSSGLAHLFEHMMFQGSAHVAKNEHGLLIDEAGGQWNASTNKDRTLYFDTLPSHYLELALWLEADRMSSLAVTEENFENQRRTVIEEKKQSYDNQPYGLAHLRFDALAYDNWAYGHPIIGSVQDLEEATIEDAVAFHARFYGPGNAVLVLAGDFRVEDARNLIHKHFGAIQDRTAPAQPDLSEPPQCGEKLEELSDPLAMLPAVGLAFHMPELDSPDYYALSMLSLLLAEGDSSRLYRRFVYDNNWITGLYAGPNQYRGPGLFRIWFQVQQGADLDRILASLDEELQQLGEKQVSEAEFGKAKAQIKFRMVSRMERISQVGSLLAEATSLLADPDLANRQLDKFLQITATQVREAAARTFRSENRSLLIVRPGKR
jgi:zinc protease